MLADRIGMSKLRDMASKSERVVVDVSLQNLPRLAGLLYPDSAASDQQIRMQFDIRRGTQGLPEINGSASGFVNLRCQRCLGLLEWPVELQFSLAVAESEAEIAKSPAPFDTVMPHDGGISLLELGEDELLASLPLAPMHENPATCEVPDPAGAERNAGMKIDDLQPAKVIAAEDLRRPFAGLAALLKQEGSAGNSDKS